LRKKEPTSFDITAVVRELKETILDSRVSNVYQIGSKTILFKLHKAEQPALWLISEAGKRLHSTAYASEKPSVPPAFCMALRKYLRNSLLTDVEQYEFERIAIFHFRTKEGKLQLVLELFGEGNIILVDEKGIILQALAYKRMRDRNVLRGEAFAFAPSSGANPFKVDKTELKDGLRKFGDVEVVRALARFLSIGGIHAEEILLRTQIEKTKPCKMLSDADIDAIYDCLQALLVLVRNGKLEPCIVLDKEGEYVDAVPFRLKRYEDYTFKPYDSFNEALDEFYVKVSAIEKSKLEVRLETEKLRTEADRLRRVINTQEKGLAEADKEAERYKRIGDAIYAHIGELKLITDRFLSAKKNGKLWTAIISEISTQKKANVNPWTFFDSFDTKSLMVYVCIDGFSFGLDLRKTLYECAGEFYERAKRAKQKVEGAKTALRESQKRLKEVEAKIREIEALEHVEHAEVMEKIEKRKVKHKEWYEKFRWFSSSDGFLIVAGKDAVSNEILIKKHTEQNDIVFHADIAGAPFVIIKTEGKQPTEQCLREAGEFAAAFSRGWREGFASADVYWVKPEQLGKGGPSGEYVPHGAFVVSGKRNWMRNVPLRVAVGVTTSNENEKIRFVGGPIDAVKAKTNAYVTIAPGDQKIKDLFKSILKILAGKSTKELKEKLSKANIEDIRDFTPYNKGRVLEN